MFEGMAFGQIIAILSPLLLIQAFLAIFCIVKIAREGTRTLNRPIWLVIVILVNFIGPIVFLLFGKRSSR